MESQSRQVIVRSRLILTRCIVLLANVSGVAACYPKDHESDTPISYGRQIAAIFALHCNGCHGESYPSSALQTSTYSGLRAGGVLGDDIVPGSPDRSTLVKFIEGFRGPDQRMSQGSRPLSAPQINLIRRWIAEGALNDRAATLCYNLRLPVFPIVPNRPLHISCRVSVPADLVLYIKEGNHTLYREEASIKQSPERMDRGAPGDLLSWTLSPRRTWPRNVTVELLIRYAPGGLRAALEAQDGNSTSTTHNLLTFRTPPD